MLRVTHGQGSRVVDNLIEVASTPRLSRTCFLNPSGDGHAYFFSGNQYAIVDVKPGATDTLEAGPKPIPGNWSSLVQARFGNIDAILPNPNNLTQEAYFFCGTQYVLINTKLGRIFFVQVRFH
jgi:hypothetical protein